MSNSRALQNGTILDGKYMIDSVIGEGGFGITYKATDLTLEETVAIKEYFPSLLATRDTTSGKSDEITIITGDSETAFKRGVKKFEEEAARLAKFQREPGIVSVKTFFHENNTGYMVMEYIDGITLKEYLEKHGGKVSPDEAKKIMERILLSLSNVHSVGIAHRDISPDNIMITSDGWGKLIDFGAARFVGNEDEKSLTVILKEGYAPPEQYHTDGKQGPWTDIYAICATMYRMVSGTRPQEASGRLMNGDEVVPLSKCAGANPVFSRTIEKGMSIEAEKRYQTVEKLISAFDGKKIPRKYYVIAGGVALAAVMTVFIVLGAILRKSRNTEMSGPINKKDNGQAIIPDDITLVDDSNSPEDEIETTKVEKITGTVSSEEDNRVHEFGVSPITEYQFCSYNGAVEARESAIAAISDNYTDCQYILCNRYFYCADGNFYMEAVIGSDYEEYIRLSDEVGYFEGWSSRYFKPLWVSFSFDNNVVGYLRFEESLSLESLIEKQGATTVIYKPIPLLDTSDWLTLPEEEIINRVVNECCDEIDGDVEYGVCADDFDSDGNVEWFIFLDYSVISKYNPLTDLFFLDENGIYRLNRKFFWRYNSFATFMFGKIKICDASSSSIHSFDEFYEVTNNGIIEHTIPGVNCYDGGFYQTDNAIRFRETSFVDYDVNNDCFFLEHDSSYACPSSNTITLWYLDGEFVECASTKISEEEFRQYEGSQKYLESLNDVFSEYNIPGYQSHDDDYIIDSIMKCSDGYIYINCVPCQNYDSYNYNWNYEDGIYQNVFTAEIILSYSDSAVTFEEIHYGYREERITELTPYYP